MADGGRVAVYYQTQYDRSLAPNSDFGHYVSPLPLISLITHLIVAAFHINIHLPTTIALNDNSPDDAFFSQMWLDVATMQSQGVKVTGMLGGAAAGTYDALTPEYFDTYYPQLAHYIAKYNLDGMDLDVEQSVPIDDIVHLINKLKEDFGDDFIITLAPVASAMTEGGNLSGFDYVELEKRVGHKISFYNVQFYSGFGDLSTDEQYIEIVNFGWDPTKLVATTLTNPDNGGGWVPPDEVVSTIENLMAEYGTKFGGVAGSYTSQLLRSLH